MAQLISIEHSTAGLDELRIADHKHVRTLPDLGVHTASFTTTEPQQLFGGNVVYVDPSQEPATSKPDDFVPAELSIPPFNEDPNAAQITIPSVDPQPAGPQSAGSTSGFAEESLHNFKHLDIDEKRLMFSCLMREPYAVYRTEQSMFAWLPGHGENFGWLDWQSDPYLRRGKKHGLTGAFNIHWLAGPISSPLPPRLYDFALGYQVRDKLSNQFSYDLYTSVGAYSDFEASARKAIRFPSHAVGMLHIDHSTDFVFGVDYLARDDIPVLPVIGVSLRDVFLPGMRMDLVFPRPRIAYMLSETSRMYLAGQMNGGTWQVRFPDSRNPVMTYRDYRLLLGFESTHKGGSLSSWEFGYVFGRNLEFRELPGDTHFDDAFVIQWVSRH